MPLVDARGFNLQPNVPGNIASGFNTGQQLRGQFVQNREAENTIDRQNQFRELTSQVLDPSLSNEERAAAQRQRSAVNPERAAKIDSAGFKNLNDRNKSFLTSVVQGAAQINSIPTVEGKLRFIQERKAQLQRDGLPTTDTEELEQLLLSGDAQGAQGMIDKVITLGQQAGILQSPKSLAGGLASAKTEILDSGAVIQALPDGTVQVRDPSGKVVTGQARLDALKQSRQQALNTLSAEADIKVDEAGRKEAEKIKAQLKLKPQLEADITKARILAKQNGEAFTELKQMNAALPGLTSTVNTLRELAPIATSTLGGRVFDTAVKESGFGATKGATARAKFIAIINNQVLPLLKQTFGGSFSVQEGESLKATMGDPNATPAEKMAQLDAFIAQKVRNIEERENILKTDDELTPDEQAELDALEAEFGNP